ncbi:MAG TPA: hypothetical protein VGG02_14545 [Chthoniobacterales bacterium]|jgi:hypothetical protein
MSAVEILVLDAGQKIAVREVEQIDGGDAHEFRQTLYRACGSRQYYLEKVVWDVLPALNGSSSLPGRNGKLRAGIRAIGEEQAMLWCVDAVLNDRVLRKRFRKAVCALNARRRAVA